jgi:hypothetical protein
MTAVPALALPLDLRLLVVLAGAGQLVLAAASLAIPRVLGWHAELRAITPMTRQVFWTYAAYVWGAHVAFGLVSVLAPDHLLDGTALARAVCAFVAVWWAARLAVALVGCERRELPDRAAVRWAHVVLLLAFTALAAGYGFVALGGGGAP